MIAISSSLSLILFAQSSECTIIYEDIKQNNFGSDVVSCTAVYLLGYAIGWVYFAHVLYQALTINSRVPGEEASCLGYHAPAVHLMQPPL